MTLTTFRKRTGGPARSRGAGRDRAGGVGAPSPLLVLALAVAACLAALMLPTTLPIGPMYWDLVVYFDAANRLFDGQLPSVDFFAPVGPLGYWLFAGFLSLFSDAQPLLLVQWSLFAVTAPAMMLVLSDVDRGSRGVALTLLAPFLVFQILPMNVEQYSSYPSVDGYGIYNRQVCEVLYVLASALVFVRTQRVLFAVVAWTCLALFLLKITGFLAAGLLCLFAFAAGRLALRTAIAAGAAFLLALLLLDGLTGIVGAYLRDIGTLVALNEDALLPRFVQAASIHFGIFGSGCLLLLVLLVQSRRSLADSAGAFLARPSPRAFASLLDRDPMWLAAALVAGLFFEAQNTGGQAFIFLWPMLLAILVRTAPYAGGKTLLVAGLVAATALPPFVNVLHRTARALVGQVKYVDLPQSALGPLGRVTQRPDAISRAAVMKENYAAFPETYRWLADRGQLPDSTLYAELDFQLGWLMTVDDAVKAVRTFEATHGVRFRTIMAINFVNPFPYLLDRSATQGIAIGADPFRAVPTPDAGVLANVAATDLILYPSCPVTNANQKLLALYASALAAHERIELTPCWTAYLRPGLRG